ERRGAGFGRRRVSEFLHRHADRRGRDDSADVHASATFNNRQQHANPVMRNLPSPADGSGAGSEGSVMQIARVVGHATSTVKHPTLNGWRVLVVQMLTADEKADGEPVLVIDSLGAPHGGKVIVTTDAVQVRELVGSKNSPIRYSVMGLADE